MPSTARSGPGSALGALFAAVLVAPLPAQQTVSIPGSDRSLTPRLEEVFRVGKIDGAHWEIFGERPEVAFDATGNLYVFDPTSHRVVVIGPNGRFLRQIGKRGDGPGELRSPMGFTVMRDGTVAIADLGQAAFLLFSSEGTFLRSVSFRGGEGLTILGDLHPDPRGGALLSSGRRLTMRTPGGAGGPRPFTALTDRSILTFNLGEPGSRNVLFTGWGPEPAPLPTGRAAGPAVPGLGVRPPDRAFEPSFFAGVLPGGGMVVSDSTAYRLKILSPEGQLQRILERPIQPRPVTAQMQRAERERRLAEFDAGSGPAGGGMVAQGGGGGGGGAPSPSQMRAAQRERLEQLQFYHELPVVTGLRTGWSGKIWVARRSTGRDIAAPGPIDVLNPGGEYLGTLAANSMQLPDAFGPNGLVAWIERDRFDTPIMVVRRLPTDLR